MLLIAQPKTASTSLAFTLGRIGKLRVMAYNNRKMNDIINSESRTIARYHHNVFEKSSAYIQVTMQHRNILYREHIFPTHDHLQKIKSVNENFIVLLRNPLHSFDCYQRINIRNIEIKKELYYFYKGFKHYKNNNMLIIYYGDLVLRYEKTMVKIMKHLNIKGRIIPLLREKYTGVGERRLKK
jgi:hypothetical protein